MEKNCLNCKYYHNRQCYNKALPIQSRDNTKNKIIDFIEDGILSSCLLELLTSKKLKEIFLNDFINRLIEGDFIKKNKINNLLDELYNDNEEIEIIENLDYIISKILLSKFDNNKSAIEILEPENFYCCNWE